MKKSELLRALQGEIRSHTFDYFVENPPAMANGGHGVVVPACPACRKRINTMAQFLDHLLMMSCRYLSINCPRKMKLRSRIHVRADHPP